MTWTFNQGGLNQPALDCLGGLHIWVEHAQPGAWATEREDMTPWASWCIWCGTGVSNEVLNGGEVE